MGERATQIGMPWMPKLDLFGDVVYRATGDTAYLVGSALKRRDFRDVDVRLLVSDEDFARHFGQELDWRSNPLLAGVNMAFAALGHEMTGLPIDFQIEQLTAANEDENSGRRNPLGVGLRLGVG